MDATPPTLQHFPQTRPELPNPIQQMRHEHVNDAVKIVDVVRWFLEEFELRDFPAFGRHLSFYTALRARHPRRECCLNSASG